MLDSIYHDYFDISFLPKNPNNFVIMYTMLLWTS